MGVHEQGDDFKIFLIDDQHIANFINRKLIEVAGICNNVMEFVNPLEALAALEKEPPDLIFLDLNMPEIDGWTFLDRMGNSTVRTKVVIVTSSTCHSDMERAKRYGQVIDYCTKPLNKNRVQALRQQVISTRATFGDQGTL